MTITTVIPTTRQWLNLHDQLERTIDNLDFVRRMNHHWIRYVKKAEVLQEMLTYVETHTREDGIQEMEKSLRERQASLEEVYQQVKEEWTHEAMITRGLYEGTEIGLLYLSYITKD